MSFGILLIKCDEMPEKIEEERTNNIMGGYPVVKICGFAVARG